MALSEQDRTYLMTPEAILGHQYRAQMIKTVRLLPGCPEPGRWRVVPRRFSLMRGWYVDFTF